MFAPEIVTVAVELGDDSICISPPRIKCCAGNGGCAPESPRDDSAPIIESVKAWDECDSSAEWCSPDIVAITVKFGSKSVGTRIGCKCDSAKVGCSLEPASDDEAAITECADVMRVDVFRSTKSFGPQIVAVAVELGDETVVVPCTCEVGGTKAGCALEVARDDGATITEIADVCRVKVLRSSDMFDPEIVAVAVEFGDVSLVVVTCICEVGGTKAGCTLEAA